MIDAPDREQLRAGMARLQPVWATFVLSLGFYLFICHQVGGPDGGDRGRAAPVRNVLGAVAVGEAAAIPYLRKRMLSAGSRAAGPRAPAARGQGSGPGAPAAHPAVSRYAKAVFVSAALAESIGVYGMVLFFLGAGLPTLYGFMIPATLLLFAYRPKMEELESLADAMQRGTGA